MILEKDIEIPGKNPFEQDLKQKINLLEAFQTERTAKEFYETVQKIFSHYNLSPKRPWFIDRRNFITFTENPTEAISLTADSSGEIIAHYGKFSDEKIEQEVFVGVVPAYKIIALDKRRREGEISPLEKMPISMQVNGKLQRINYS